MQPAQSIIVIKTEPRIDILRAASILDPLKRLNPGAEITFVTSRRNRILLQRNPMIDRLLFIEDGGTIATALNRRFRLALNFDKELEPSCLMNLIDAERKCGFTAAAEGGAHPIDIEAEPLWRYETSPLEFSREYGLTYQAGLMHCCSLDTEPAGEMVFIPSDQNREYASRFAVENRIDPEDKPVVVFYFGINPGFPPQYYPAKKASFAAEYLMERMDAAVILLAGPREQALLERAVLQSPPGVINGGWETSLDRCAALLELAHLVIAPDTLCLQLALALEKKAVALLGASHEGQFEFYGRGAALVSTLECAPCGGEIECPEDANCLNEISPEDVFQTAKSLLEGTPT